MKRCLLGVFAMMWACAAAKPAPVQAIAVPSVSAPSVRWNLASLRDGKRGSINLADGRSLAFGVGGARWLEGDKPQLTSDWLPDTIVSAYEADDGRVVFFSQDQRVFVTQSALGPLIATHGRADNMQPGLYVGRHLALVASDMSSYGAISTSEQPAWRKVNVPLLPYESFVKIALDTTTDTLVVLTSPRRILVSNDRGKTFTSIATPGFGVGLAQTMQRHVQLYDFFRFADLDTKTMQWRVTAGAMPDEEAPQPPTEVTYGYVGKAIARYAVTKAAGSGTITDRSLSIGPGPDNLHDWGSSKSSARARIWSTIDGWGDTVGLLQWTHTGNGFEILQSRDAGVSWNRTHVFVAATGKSLPIAMGEGSSIGGYAPTLFAGPGVYYVSQLCEDSAKLHCKAYEVHDHQEAVAIGSRFIENVAFDTTRRRAYLAMTDYDSRDSHIMSEPLEGGALTEVAHGSGEVLAMSVDAIGVLRVFREASVQVVNGSANVTLKHTPFVPRGVTFASERGLAWQDYPPQAFETADGGATWSPVPTPEGQRAWCRAEGCLTSEGLLRVGWALAANEKGKLALADTPPATPDYGPNTDPRIDHDAITWPPKDKTPAPLVAQCSMDKNNPGREVGPNFTFAETAGVLGYTWKDNTLTIVLADAKARTESIFTDASSKLDRIEMTHVPGVGLAWMRERPVGKGSRVDVTWLRADSSTLHRAHFDRKEIWLKARSANDHSPPSFPGALLENAVALADDHSLTIAFDDGTLSVQPAAPIGQQVVAVQPAPSGLRLFTRWDSETLEEISTTPWSWNLTHLTSFHEGPSLYELAGSEGPRGRSFCREQLLLAPMPPKGDDLHEAWALSPTLKACPASLSAPVHTWSHATLDVVTMPGDGEGVCNQPHQTYVRFSLTPEHSICEHTLVIARDSNLFRIDVANPAHALAYDGNAVREAFCRFTPAN